MKRGSRGFPFATVVLAGMMVLLAVPAPTSAGNEESAGPCAGFSLLPPVVHADPACLEGGAGSSNPFDVTAERQLLGTHVAWEYLGDPDVVVEYEVFRGETPSTMNRIAWLNVTDPKPSGGEYLDPWSPATSDETWYAVGALLEHADGSQAFVMSDAYLVQVIS